MKPSQRLPRPSHSPASHCTFPRPLKDACQRHYVILTCTSSASPTNLMLCRDCVLRADSLPPCTWPGATPKGNAYCTELLQMTEGRLPFPRHPRKFCKGQKITSHLPTHTHTQAHAHALNHLRSAQSISFWVLSPLHYHHLSLHI